MYPINDIKGINYQESQLDGGRVVILLLVKPSDSGADEYIKKINYMHYRSKQFCSIYMLGYSRVFGEEYPDIVKVKGVNNKEWQYSDLCFTNACDELEERLSNWRYSGEPEMIILQSNPTTNARNCLNFANYNHIDINYGIEKKYIDSFPRFMERLIKACEKEVTAMAAVEMASRKRFSTRKIIEYAIEQCPRLPMPMKKILQDKMFYKSYRSN